MVKEAVLKSIIKGLPVANHGKLMEAAVAFSVLNISLEVEYTQHYNLCRCENGSYGKWYWFPQNTKVTHMISEMNPGKGRGGAAGRAITSVTIPEIPGQIKTVIDKAVNNGNWDFRKSSKDTIKNEEKCN